MPKHRKKPPIASAPLKSLKPGVIEEGDAKSINWLIKYLYNTSVYSRTNRTLLEVLNERCQHLLSKLDELLNQELRPK